MFEHVEPRILLATFQVTVAGDLDSSGGPVSGSFRAALAAANANPGPDRIEFAIPAGVGEVPRISPIAPLPPVLDSVSIDAGAQPGARANTRADGDDAIVGVELDGSLAGTNTDGLLLLAGGSVVRGLSIFGFSGAGVRIVGGGGNRVEGCFLGLDATGRSAPGNGGAGVSLIASPRTTVGGLDLSSRNVIAGNKGAGVEVIVDLRQPNPGTAEGTSVLGNLIGTDATGLAAIGNQSSGVTLIGSRGVAVGGSAPGSGNLISGNQGFGLLLSGAAQSNTVQGNLVGCDITGRGLLRNAGPGLALIGASSNLIGGTAPGARNVVSGNASFGILIASAIPGGDIPIPIDIFIPTAGNILQGNYVGLDATGTAPLNNFDIGIFVANAFDNVIGGSAPGAGNVVAGNRANGIDLGGPLSVNNSVQGNRVGTSADGTRSMGNFGDGISVEDEASSNRIGGTAPGEGNLVSANRGSGVSLANGASNNVVQGNLIGLDALGRVALGNGRDGVLVIGGMTDRNGFRGSNHNVIGGATPQAGNTISGNSLNGVEINGDRLPLDARPVGNLVAGNLIGLDATGARAVKNGVVGVVVSNAPSNVIGGSAPGAGNTISGNGLFGVKLNGGATTGVTVQGNRIGTDVTGTRSESPEGSPIGNVQAGVYIDNAIDNLIGGALPEQRNIISGNQAFGLMITGQRATRNRVQGNFVGTNASGTAALGNTQSGVVVINAVGNMIGGAAPGEGNLVSANGESGVMLSGQWATGNRVQGNRVGTDVTGTRILGNSGNGVLVNGAPANLIGGNAKTSEGNLVSGNGGQGIHVVGSLASDNAVRGNRIGTSLSGLAPLGNAQSGVLVESAPGTVVGGAEPGSGNVISANRVDGVRVLNVSAGTTLVRGNRIGTDDVGLRALGNAQDGVSVIDSPATVFGGAAPGEGNLISANGSAGVEVRGGPTATSILGNTIGTDRFGRATLGNAIGVFMNGVRGGLVGGTSAGSGNRVAGNLGAGVQITRAAGVVVQGNRIGLGADDSSGAPNGIGVVIDAASGILVGGEAPGAGNVISGNTTAGVFVNGRDSVDNRVAGNVIGLDAAGRTAVVSPAGPQRVGVLISGASRNTVGGTTVASRNVISGNVVGVNIASFDPVTQGNTRTTTNTVQGNYIGTDASGLSPAGNTVGVYVNGVPNNLIGGGAPGARNVIAANATAGVLILGALSTGNQVFGNVVGLGADGRTVFAHPDRSRPSVSVFNQAIGVSIEDASNNQVGDLGTGLGNVISGNEQAGVYVFGRSGSPRGNLIVGNMIGSSAGGNSNPGNHQYGVLLYNAPNNRVGPAGPRGNLFRNNSIANIREFSRPATSSRPSVRDRAARA